ncbi:MAG: DNA repair protein RecN [Peptococcaceae bacterium]|jgi:DNA repair protein RecN (Recombination protein N)|nr:DNA repair protein RecN [Peptococcaceae bacterium]
MLERLLIKQFAIIDQMEVDFAPPFTVLTGETGAGKSILIDAVTILLGGRAQSEMIRHGAEKAYIEGVFSFPAGHPVWRQLAESGWGEEGEEAFALSRELSQNGKNACRINGCAATLSQYRRIALGLLDIHGQHDYQQLMQSQRQLEILDAFGGQALRESKARVREAYREWKNKEDALAAAREKQKTSAAQKDFLAFQIREIDEARLSPGEAEGLTLEIQRLTHSQKILRHLEQAHQALLDGGETASAYDQLSRALRQLRDAAKYDPALSGVQDRLEPATYILDEAIREIGQYRDQLEPGPGRLEEAENRLYQIRSLCKKYGGDEGAALAHRQAIAEDLAGLEEFFSREEEWAAETAAAEKAYLAQAMELRRLRLEIKARLEGEIDREFLDLSMAAAHFVANLEERAPGSQGIDGAEFLISTNAGEPFLPLAKIASGGELSRITLAMKRVLAAIEACETMIFDEIDSGIGGVAAQRVAEKLWSISRSQQVICVTHTAVIAARANQHLALEKEESRGRTRTAIRALVGEARVDELVRMLGGQDASGDLRRHARALLEV